MQKKQTHTNHNEFATKLGVVAVSLATMAAAFTHNAPPNKQPIVAVEEVHKLFEQKVKILHPHEKYVVRAQHETSIGAGAA